MPRMPGRDQAVPTQTGAPAAPGTHLRVFIFHGVDGLSTLTGSDQAEGVCPFCDKPKFRVSVATGLFDCKVCGVSGNSITFLRQLWERSLEATAEEDYRELAEDRKLLSWETLKEWGVAKSVITGEWLLPGFSLDGKLNQLYRYAEPPGDDRKALLASPGLKQHLLGVNLLDRAKKGVIRVAEGPWDGMALWETIRLTDRDKDESVVAVPGCAIFSETWLPLFEGRTVNLLYDSDHPRRVGEGNGRVIPPSGWAGMVRAAGILARGAKDIWYLHWGDEGYDPDLPSGYDLRDFLAEGETAQQRIARMESFFEKLVEIDKDSLERAGRKVGTALECSPCSTWKELSTAWRKALKWTPGLDRALSAMLASITSTMAVGDQLWMKIVGPAACGKSTLCEALSVNKTYVIAKSTIRGFHSGFKTDAEGKEDNSLVSKLSGKTLVTKDGDTLLQSPNLGQVLSEARDLYDTTGRAHYRNAVDRAYEGVRWTWILCGTASLRSLDSSELGERFLDCVIMEAIDEELEDEILWRKVNQADRSMNFQADGKLETQQDPDLVNAMRLTGGYIDYLRQNANSLLQKVDMPEETKWDLVRLGKFVAYMRARPSLKQEETAEREFATRLVSQLTRLAKCIAVVLNKPTVDDPDVMGRVKAIAMDTARGRTLEIAKHLYEAGPPGTEAGAVSVLTGEVEEKVRALLKFLRKIGAVEYTAGKPSKLGMVRPKWRLSDRMAGLWQRIFDEGREEQDAEDAT